MRISHLLSLVALFVFTTGITTTQGASAAIVSRKVVEFETVLTKPSTFTEQGSGSSQLAFSLTSGNNNSFHQLENEARGTTYGNSTPEQCYPKISFALKLANTLGQKIQVSGIEIRGNLMEMYVNPTSGTWTLAIILPRGLACEIGHGTDFKIEPHPPKV